MVTRTLSNRSTASSGDLPLHVSPDANSVPRAYRRFVASEAGSGPLLPDFNLSTSIHASGRSCNRSQTSSESSPVTISLPLSPVTTPSKSFFRRALLQLDPTDVQKLLDAYYLVSDLNRDEHRKPRRNSIPMYQMLDFQEWSLTHVVQVLVVMAIVCLVFGHNTVSEATVRLQQYRREENVLVHQLDRIESQTKELQENLFLLGGNISQMKVSAQMLQLQKDIGDTKRAYMNVDKEVHALQEFLQRGARNEMTGRYGSGSVHVTMELGLVEGPGAVTMELFDETPHANWLFLQLVLQGAWHGAKFNLNPTTLAALSKATDTKLAFVEPSFRKHEAWTVGLSPSEHGTYQFFINLSDNLPVHEGDVCFGKIVGGFETLQRLILSKSAIDVPIQNLRISTVQRSRTARR